MKDKLKKFFINDKFAASNGMKILDVAEGYGKSELVVEDSHLNGVKILQGGAIFTLADLSFAVASNSHGRVAVGLQNNINYIKPGFKGDTITAEAKEISRGRTISTYEVLVTNQNNELISTFQGTAYVKKSMLFKD